MANSRLRYRGEFLGEHISVDPATFGADRIAAHPYLSSAKLRIQRFSEAHGRVTLRLAHFPQATFAMVATAPVEAVWERDDDSRGRGLVVVARRGEIEVTAQRGVIVRGRTAALVAPGTDDVIVRTMGPVTELLYVSVPVSLIPPGTARLRERLTLPAVEWEEVAPMYMFAHALVEPPPSGVNDARAFLAEPALHVARALAAVLADGANLGGELHARAVEYLEQHYPSADLTVATVAAALGTVPRTLQAAFTGAGTTFTRELRERRVRALYELSDTKPRRRLTDVYAEAGFTSISAMNRAIRASRARDARPWTRLTSEPES